MRIACRIGISLLLLCPFGGNAADRPNVLILVSDDQQADTIRALGNEHIQTPNLDRLVARGTACTHAYCMGSTVGAVCVPSRAMFLTGRSLYRIEYNLPPSIPLIPEQFAKTGYVTHGIGKWHNGPASYARAFAGGGSIFFGGMSNQFKVPVFDFQSDKKYPKDRQKIGDKPSSELFADSAVQFLKGHKGDKPFFLYVAFTSPHDPRTPPQEYARMYDPAKLPLPKNFLPQHPFNNGEMTIRDEKLAPWPRTPEVIRRQIADYYGMISHLDAQVGRILKALDDSGQTKNTLIAFYGDHGLALGRHGLLGKQNLYEHSMKAPLIFAGPGVPPGKKSDAFCYLFDVQPTLCDLAGVKAPDGIDGRSLKQSLSGQAANHRDVIFCAYGKVMRSVRDSRWKLIRYPHINRSQLFDLQNDPDEITDLAAKPEHAATLKRMNDLLIAQQKQFADTQALSTDSRRRSRWS
jgi:arylsulfatase A-like enzyme